MINKKATIKWKHYNPDDLTSGSSKRIWVNCNECGKGRWIMMYNCHDDINLCLSCATKGKNNNMYGKYHSKNTRNKISIANTNPSKETRQKISDSQTKDKPKYDKVSVFSNLTLPEQYVKRLFGLATDGTGIEIDCSLNSKTKTIIINTKFYKISDAGMENNRSCTSYLGVHIAEQVLFHVFKNVERMPYGNPGYDFICGKGFKIDVKSACRRERETWSDQWGFSIKHNTIADYFLCIGFDNRKDLNPEHIWLIPGFDINDKTNVAISESTLDKWSKYELDRLDDIIICCNIMKGDKND